MKWFLLYCVVSLIVGVFSVRQLPQDALTGVFERYVCIAFASIFWPLMLIMIAMGL